MADCDDRQLTEAQRQAGYQQQRTGVGAALRPFSGRPTLPNLLDYINRELVPALRRTRDAVNDIYLPVVDNAPSANPLQYYFSTDTTNADPTAGFIRLDASPQSGATTIRVSELNARLADTTPWLEVMAGGVTAPLGVVTLIDAVNPSRFIRFDLDSMTDQGDYWDLTVTPIEASHPDPFINGGGLVMSFIPGVASTGTTVPPDTITPIADDTFLANISGASAAPAAVALTTLAGDGLTGGGNAVLNVGAGDGIDVAANDVSVDVTDIIDNVSITEVATNNIQRAALTGFATASAGSNATSSAEPIVTFSASSNMSNERVLSNGTNTTVSTAVAGQISVGVDDLPLTALADQADDTFLANISGAAATPTAVALTTLAGAGLTGGADAVLNVGAGTGITVNANDVQLSTVSAETFFGNFTASTAVPAARAGTSVAGGGLTYTAGGTLAVGAGTGVTVNADDVAVTTPLTDGDKGDITVSSNGTVFTIDNDAVTNAKLRDSSGLSVIGRSANSTGDPADIAAANDGEVLRRSGTSLGFGTVANAGLANMAAARIKGRARGAGTGVPTDLTGTQVGAVLRIGGQTDAGEAPGTFDNYVVAEGTKLLRINPSSNGDVILTGIAYGSGNTDGWIRIFKQGSDGRVVFKHENTGSSASNRFQLPNGVDFILDGGNEAVDVQYIGGRWQLIGANRRFERVGAPVYDVVLDFGAAADGTTDDTAAINAAIAAANATPGVIQLGRSHVITAALDPLTGNNVVIKGRGGGPFNGGSQILLDSASAPAAAITIEGQYCGIEDCRIMALQAHTTGCAILLLDAYRAIVSRCRIEEFANGIEVHASTLTTIADVELHNLREDWGIWVHGSAEYGQGHANWIIRCIGDTSAETATDLTWYLHDSYAHTMRLLDCSAVAGGYGLRVVDTLSEGADPPHFTRCVNLECDHNQHAGVVLTAGEQAEFEQLFITSVQDGPGVDIQSTFSGDWRIDGAFIFSMPEEGVRIAASDGLLKGVMVGGASVTNTNVYDAIAVAAGTERFSIVGCSGGNTFRDPSTDTRYGLSIGSGCDDYVVVGNRFTGNVTGGVLNTPGVSRTRVVRDNIPDSEAASQVISVTPGGGSATGGVYLEADLGILSETKHICFDIQSDGDVVIASLPEAIGRRLTISKTNDGTARRLIFPHFSTLEPDTNKRIALPRETSSLIIADRLETREFVNLAPTNSGTNFWFLVRGMGATENYLDNALGDAMVHNGAEWTKAAGGGSADVVLRGNATFGTVSTGAIADDSVSNAKLAEMGANTVKANATASTANPTDFSVGTNSVLGRVAGNIVAAQVVNAQITDATIANAKLANMSAATIKGRALGAGTGAPTDLSLTQLSDMFRVVTTLSEALDPGSYDNHAIAEGTKLWRINPTSAGDVELTGLLLGSSNTGGWVRLFHQGTSGTERIVLKHSNTSSTDTNRFLLPWGVDFILDRAFEGVDLQYIGGRWQVVERLVNTTGIVDNAVTDGKLRDSAALSVIGRSANSTGDPADIAAGTDGHVLRRSGTTLGFGTIATAGVADDSITNDKLAEMPANSIKANPTASSANPTDLELPDLSVPGRMGLSGTGNLEAITVPDTGTLTGERVYLGSNAGRTGLRFTNITLADFPIISGPRFIGKQTGTGRPEYVPFGNLNSATITFEFTNNTFIREALFGDVVALQNNNETTIQPNVVDDTKLRDSAALSVIGRSANSTGDPADIAAANDGEVLRRSGTSLGFGTIATAGLTDASVTNAKLANMSESQFKGRSAGAGTGAPQDLTGAQAGQIIRFATVGADPLGSGTVTTLEVAPTANSIRWTPTGDITVLGMAMTGPATPAGGEQVLIYNSRTSTALITFAHNSGSAAAAEYRFFCPGNVNLTLRPGDAVLWRYFVGRWIATSRAGVSDADYGDITVSAGGATWTIDNNVVSDAKLRDSAALSVIGRSANSTGDPADIAAGTDGHVLRRSGTTLGFGTIATAGITDDAVTDAKLRESAALSVIGRSANSTGNPADIAAANDGEVLRRSGTTLGFGTIATAGLGDNTVTNAKLRQGGPLTVIGRNANTPGNVADIAASASSGGVLRESGSTIGFGTVATAGIADAAVTLAKMANLAESRIIGRDVGAGTGVPQALTPAEVVDIIETTIEGRAMAWTAGPQVFLAGIYNSGSTQLDGVISPTITGDVIDWNPTGLSSATVVRVTASGGAWSIQSIVGDSGTVLVIINVGTNAVTIANNGSGTSQYRIIHTMDSPVLSQNESMTLWYDGTSNFWRVIATGGSVSP